MSRAGKIVSFSLLIESIIVVLVSWMLHNNCLVKRVDIYLR